MTKKEVAAAHLSLMENGTIALTEDKNGKTQVLREFTEEEVTNLLTVFFLSHVQRHPEVPVMVLPLNDEQSMIVNVVESRLLGK